MRIRQPLFAGTFYPGNRNELENMIVGFLNNAKKQCDAKAIIVPHAGYVYSGQVAAHGFRQLAKAKNAFILAANHTHAAYQGASVPGYTHYKTPLGNIKVSGITKKLIDKGLFSVDEAHSSHVEEVELPFIQRLNIANEITPIMTCGLEKEEAIALANLIDKYLDDSIIVVSMDLSHFHPYEEAIKLDRQSINAILDSDTNKIYRCEVDGPELPAILIHLAKKHGWTAKLLDYKNSGDTAGSRNSVVGYAAIAFC